MTQGDAQKKAYRLRNKVRRRSSEKRLARILAVARSLGKEGVPEAVVPKTGQETLAEMVGTTQSRASVFMNRFRKLGFIHYNGGLEVHSSLLNVVLHDSPDEKRVIHY